ncbi:MAG: SET domain-containing protein [Verrucomicrobiales bacterium]|jgi:SET domain-containing protein
MAEESIDEEASVWEIRSSGIHNQGVFARQKIEEGHEIIQYLGERISHDEADERGIEREAMVHGSGEAAVYLFTLNDDWVLDGNDEDNSARLINHSCDPNCEAVIYGEGEDAEIWLVARRNLKKGEELSFDYGFDLENFEGHPCLCGAKKCVGYIVGEDYRAELKKLLKKKKKKAERGKNGKGEKGGKGKSVKKKRKKARSS